jgi:hypothetical protein
MCGFGVLCRKNCLSSYAFKSVFDGKLGFSPATCCAAALQSSLAHLHGA